MATIKIEMMGGMRPILDPRQLPDAMAAFCSNAIVRTGALRPLSMPVELFRWTAAHYPSARRLRFNDGSSMFYPLTSIDSEIIKAPLVNDAYERFYILDPPKSPMRFNTKARILAGQPSYLLGMPAPTPAPTVGHTGGNESGLKETRAYVYTYVDQYGQESPPSDAGLHTAPIDATQWNISGMATTITSPTERPTITKKIYRTQVADGGGVSYKHVADIPLSQATYTDTRTNPQVALDYSLGTISYLPPGNNFEGIINMPGGFIVAWEGRNLHMSEPYRPWAWPAEYDLALDYAIIGCGIIQQTLAVGTSGHPYTLSGNTPAAMTPSKQDRFEPCISRQSVVGGIDAVYYASANGLIAVNAGGTQDLTKDVIGRELWLRDFATSIFGAGRIGSNYIALNNKEEGLGFLLSTSDAREAVIMLQDYKQIQSLWDDSLQDDVLGNFYDGVDTTIIRLSPRDTLGVATPRPFAWRSKEFFLSQPTNFAVMQVQAEGVPLGYQSQDVVTPPSSNAPAVNPGDEDEVNIGSNPLTSDQVHMRMGLSSMIGMCGIGSMGAYLAETTIKGTLPPGATPPGWLGYPFWPGVNHDEGQLVDFDLTIPAGEVGVMRVYSNRKLVYKDNLFPNMQVRLPDGFKSTVWQILLVANVPVFSIHLATHGRELASV